MPQSSSHLSSTPTLPIGHLPVTAPLRNIPAFNNHGIDPAQVSLNRLQQLVGALDNTLRLPSTPRAFAVYLLGLVIVFVGAFLHVLVAAQIMQAEFTLAQLQEEYREIEQQNGYIIFELARQSNMTRLHEAVVAAGYVPPTEREFIVMNGTTQSLATAGTALDTVNATTAAPRAATPEATEDAPPSLPVARTTTGHNQWARWQEFWRDTLGMAAGSGNPSPTLSSVSSNRATLAADAGPNFWAVWWQQASEQGAKLLEQLPGQ